MASTSHFRESDTPLNPSALPHAPDQICTMSSTRTLRSLLLGAFVSLSSLAFAQSPGDVVAWGDGIYGQTSVPAGLVQQARVSAGAGHTLALGLDGTVTAWGRNNYGQTTVPATLGPCRSMSAGAFHSVAVKQDGTLAAWGRNNYLQCDPPAGLLDAVQVSAGGFHNLALRSDGTVTAWGYNLYGQSTVPSGLGACVAVAAGYFHSVALLADGTVAAWGNNTYGQCSVPAGLNNVRAIAAGRDHTVALRADGTVLAWGRNQNGQCNVPVPLPFVSSIAAGWYHTAAVVQGGGVVAWGLNDRGQCNVPQPLAPCVNLAAGDYHTVVVLGPDCNSNGNPDELDIAEQVSADYDSNAVPDECQTVAVPFCFGDGSGSACPCGAVSSSGRGCPNNVNPEGARLEGRGLSRMGYDNLSLHTTGAPTNAAALYFQGNALLVGNPFGDGLRCASGVVRRLGIVPSVGGASQWPVAGSGAHVSVAGQLTAAGGTRYYQVWYRDPAPTYCTDSRFNLTNGLSVVWLP